MTSVQELPHSPTYNLENTILIATLKYLAFTLKNSVFKRFFLSLEVYYLFKYLTVLELTLL